MLRKTILGILFASLCATAFADTPGLDKRQEQQKERIRQGISSGELTKPEAKRLARSERRLERHEDRAEADGVVTGPERARLRNETNRTSARIHRQKHDRKDRN